MIKNETYIIAHLSDFHLCSPKAVRVQELVNKRVCGYLSWRLHRRTEHRDEVIAALLRDLHSIKPNHIVITGDLTHLGLPDEFQKAKQLLHALGPPVQVTVIPGNHDTYVSTAWDNTFAYWTDHMVSDETYLRAKARLDSRIIFPSLRIRGQTALIGVSTARPSAPFLALGSIGKEQLQKLEKILMATGQRSLFRVIMIHHPPAAGVVSWRKRLTDAEAFRGVLKRCGAELILHGHTHRCTQTLLDTPVGRIPVIGVPSASALGRVPQRRARYHIYHVKRNSACWDLRILVRGYSPIEKDFISEDESQITLPQIPKR